VPTYNERENIGELINKVENLLCSISFEFIIVDDNSPDGTHEVSKNLNVKYGNVRTIKRSRKLGLSSAVSVGFEKTNAKLLAVIDADMQHPPEVLPQMYSKISEGYDLVVASRYVDGGGTGDWKFHRMLISRVATTLAHILLPSTRKVKDVMSGCFMLRREVIDGACLNPIGFKILLEILAKCNFNQVAEVPYTFRNRRNGKSNLSPKEMRSYVIHLCNIFFSRVVRHLE
jgi:dolichol-phosphate mannosyltransferase